MRYSLIILIFLSSFFSCTQKSKDNTEKINIEAYDTTSKYTIKMNEIEYYLDSIPNSIREDWIEKIEVLKSHEHIYGNDKGTVLIYPKEKYFKQIEVIINTKPDN